MQVTDKYKLLKNSTYFSISSNPREWMCVHVYIVAQIMRCELHHGHATYPITTWNLCVPLKLHSELRFIDMYSSSNFHSVSTISIQYPSFYRQISTQQPALLSTQHPGKKDQSGVSFSMMTSSNGNIFRVTGHLCGEFTGPRWIPRTQASDAELSCFLWSAAE